MTFTRQTKIDLIRKTLSGDMSPSLIRKNYGYTWTGNFYRISSEGETVNVPESYFMRMNTAGDTIICRNDAPPQKFKGLIIGAPDPKKIAEQIYKLKNSLR